MATLSVTETGTDYLVATVSGLTAYDYTRKFYWYIYKTSGSLVYSDSTTLSSTSDGASTSYTFEDLSSDTTYNIQVLIYGNDSGSYEYLTSLSTSGTTDSDVAPSIEDIAGSYLQGEVTIDIEIYCEDKSMKYYIIITDVDYDVLDVQYSSSRSEYTVTVSMTFNYTITASYSIFYIYVSSSSDIDDDYDGVPNSIKIYKPTRQYFSWESTSLLDDAPSDDSPIQAGDALSDYLTVKKWTLLQDCLDDLDETIYGTTFGFTTVTTSTKISADIFNEVRSALKYLGVSTSKLPSAVSSGDTITATLFNKLQSACNSISV